MILELRTTSIVVVSLLIILCSLGSEKDLMAQPQPEPGGRDRKSSSITALENRRAICLTPRFVENQVIVRYEKSALLPDPSVGPGSGGVGPGGGTGDPGCGTVVPCDRPDITAPTTPNPYLSQNLPYHNRKEYILFLQARKSFLTREGKRLAEHGFTVLSTNTILGTHLLELPTNMGINDALQTLNNDPRIKNTGKNWLGCLDSHDEFPDQTAPPNEDEWLNGNLWGMVRIGMKQAWQLTTQQGHPEIIVAVIDTGIDLSHPDLKNNKWVNIGETAGDGLDNDGYGPIDDIHGADWCNMQNGEPSGSITITRDHGTNVAGVIGARGNNKGSVLPDPDGGGYVAGATWVVQLMSLRAICDESTVVLPPEPTIHRVTEAMTYAIFMGAHVINNSFGFYIAPNDPAVGNWLDAIKLADCQGPLNVPPDCRPALVVASAGNESVNINGDLNAVLDGIPLTVRRYPAFFSTEANVITVTGTSHEIRQEPDHILVSVEMDTKVWSANWGNIIVTLAAPGRHICTTSKDFLHNGFCPSETSFAAPFVTGCAALMQAKMREESLPILSASRLKEIITETAEQVPELGLCDPSQNQDCVIQRRMLNCHKAMEQLICSETCGCSGNCPGDSTVPSPPTGLTIR